MPPSEYEDLVIDYETHELRKSFDMLRILLARSGAGRDLARSPRAGRVVRKSTLGHMRLASASRERSLCLGSMTRRPNLLARP